MKNAYIGYTYQQYVTSLLLAKMDVEREFDVMEIEAPDGTNDFEDLHIQSGLNRFYFQIKDFDHVSLATLALKDNTVLINGKSHKLSTSINVISFRKIDVTPDCEIFGLPAYKFGPLYIMSLSREEIVNRISKLYQLNSERESIIVKFFSACLDNRKLKIERKDLPSIQVFDTKLIEPSIDVGRKHLEFDNMLLIEGKPGIGKSHLVNSLIKEFPGSIHYRFWISSQDKDYDQRLKYASFIFDFSKKLFNDQVSRNEDVILKKLWELKKVVIIDGLDHVENYNPDELRNFVSFMERLQTQCKTIVLTRPLQYKVTWKKYELINWNETQTRKVLDELFHIIEYDTARKIYSITNGYPILVKYLAEHYKKHNTVPDLDIIGSVDEYYTSIFVNKISTKSALTLFLCSHSFYTKQEINLFLGGELSVIVNEFIEDYPYLFDRRLNRISLLHDSFNTYLRKQNIDYTARLRAVNQVVFKSIIEMDYRFLSRLSFFDLDPAMRKEIAIKFSSISTFETLMHGMIDMESLRDFYIQVREVIQELTPDELTLDNYYELSLIINIVNRDHTSAATGFLYTYVRALLFNGYTEEHITSSGYLFAMLYYMKTGNPEILRNITSNDFYGTDHFVENLNEEIQKETLFFNKHKLALSKSKIEKLLTRDNEYTFKEKLTYVLENLFLHKKHQSDFPELTKCVKDYIDSEEEQAIYFLEEFLNKNQVRDFYAQWILNDVKKNLLALGYLGNANDYLSLSLKEFIERNSTLGSFKLSTEILNYVRLSLHNEIKFDISSISAFWTKYYNRKDYSLMGIPEALRIFEKQKLISRTQAIHLITAIQEQSEKGYRGLLAEYIELHSAGIVDFLISNLDLRELHISWFTLSSKYINRFPNRLFEFSMKKLLRYHSSLEVDFDDIENAILSNRRDEVRRILEITKVRVRAKGNKQVGFLKRNGIPFAEYTDDTSPYRQNSEERLANGILTAKDRKIIAEKNLTPENVAALGDENYSTLADISLFEAFPKDRIRKSIKSILYNALVGKVNSLNSFHNLYYFPGNVPKLVADYKVEADCKKLFESFRKYMKLSMFEIDSSAPR